MAWLSQFFINSSFVLPGMALIASPIIIHLINRLRYRRIRWAAMEFLLQSQKRNRRKLLIEQLILLMLRILAVAVLVLLVARPFFDPSQLLILQGQKSHHVVVLDDSGSMRDMIGEESAFDAAKNAVRKIAAEGARQAGTQTMTLLLTSRPDEPIYTQRDLDPSFQAEIDTRLDNLECTHGRVDLAAALDAARQHLAHPAAAKQVHLLSDFRSRDWQSEAALVPFAEELERDNVAVNFVRAVAERHPNLAVTDLSGDLHVAAANVPIRMEVKVKNFGDQVATKVRLNLFQDDTRLPVSLAIDSLEPGQEAARRFELTFPTAGVHSARVELPPDPLASDNVRHVAINVAPSNVVLILTPDVRSEESQDLKDALAASPALTGYAPQIETIEFLRRQPLTPYQCIYLLGVPELPLDTLRVLEDYAAQGGGLVWYMGAGVRPNFYNESLYKSGAGLFPIKLGTILDLLVDETNPSPDVEFEPHTIEAAIQARENPFIDLIKVSRYFGLARDFTVPDSAAVLAKLRNGAPLILEHRFGEGRIVTVLTSCGLSWVDWARNPSFVLWQLELQKYVARQDRNLHRKQVGEPIAFALDPTIYRSQIEIRPPNNAPPTRLEATIPAAAPASGDAPAGDAASAPPASATGREAVPLLRETFAETQNPGVYTVIKYRQDNTTETQAIAYNVPPEESDLTVAAADAIRKVAGPTIRLQEFGQFDWLAGKRAGQEVRDLILVVLLAILICEQLMAMRLSFHPKQAGGRA